MRYDRQNFTQIEKFYLHDASIQTISCDYKNRKVQIEIKFIDVKLREHIVKLDFVNVFNVEIPMFAPWGESYSIYEVTTTNEFVVSDSIYHDVTEAFVTRILLSSGDEIKVLATTLIQTQEPI